MTERGDNFCYNAFTGLDVNQRGSLKPCCKFDLQSMPAFNISDGIEKYTNSKFVKRLQKQFLDNKLPQHRKILELMPIGIINREHACLLGNLNYFNNK